MNKKDKLRKWDEDNQEPDSGSIGRPALLIGSLFLWMGLLSLYVVTNNIPGCDANHIHYGPETETIYLEEND